MDAIILTATHMLELVCAMLLFMAIALLCIGLIFHTALLVGTTSIALFDVVGAAVLGAWQALIGFMGRLKALALGESLQYADALYDAIGGGAEGFGRFKNQPAGRARRGCPVAKLCMRSAIWTGRIYAESADHNQYCNCDGIHNCNFL